jgi:hypothetical protein
MTPSTSRRGELAHVAVVGLVDQIEELGEAVAVLEAHATAVADLEDAGDLFVGGGFDLGNGYAERPAAALTMLAPGFSAQVTPQLGRLVSQYPPGFAALSAPLTAAFGASA